MASPFSDKIRIRLKAYDNRVLDQSTTEIVRLQADSDLVAKQ